MLRVVFSGAVRAVTRQHLFLAVLLGSTTLVRAAVVADCVAGEYFDSVSASCIPCAIGTFQGLPRQTSCRTCPIGFTTASLGGAIYTDCVCPAGTYKDSYGFCEPCPAGSASPVGSLFCACPLLGYVTAGVRDVDCTAVLSCGNNHCCQLFPCIGKVKCWGSQSTGQVGTGRVINVGTLPSQVGANLQYLNLQNVKRVQCQMDTTFFLTEEYGKKVFRSIGLGTTGQLFSESLRSYGNIASQPIGNSPRISNDTFAAIELLDVTSTGFVSCALLWNGVTVPAVGGRFLKRTELKCTGHASAAVYGTSGVPNGNNPLRLNSLKAVDFGVDYYPIESFRGQSAHSTCARMQTGDVKCWGANTYGELGYGDVTPRGTIAVGMGDALPILNFGTNYMISISSADQRRCVVLDNGKATCWGANTAGDLGLGHIALTRSPGQYVLLGNTPALKQLQIGSFFGCALFRSTGFKCWGDGTQRQVGYGDTRKRGTTVASMGDSIPYINFAPDMVVDIQISRSTPVCIMFSDGRVKCWGEGGAGQLCQGTTSSTPSTQKAYAAPFSNIGGTQGCFRTNNASTMAVCQALLL
jgi:Tyrosine-protein kinase ephrin type A/B receptor-like